MGLLQSALRVCRGYKFSHLYPYPYPQILRGYPWIYPYQSMPFVSCRPIHVLESCMKTRTCPHPQPSPLLPAARAKAVIARLRFHRKFPALAARTNRFQSFINFGFLWQTCIISIFIFSLRIVHCLLCFRLFLYIIVCTRLFAMLGLSSLCKVTRSSDRKGVLYTTTYFVFLWRLVNLGYL